MCVWLRVPVAALPSGAGFGVRLSLGAFDELCKIYLATNEALGVFFIGWTELEAFQCDRSTSVVDGFFAFLAFVMLDGGRDRLVCCPGGCALDVLAHEVTQNLCGRAVLKLGGFCELRAQVCFHPECHGDSFVHEVSVNPSV